MAPETQKKKLNSHSLHKFPLKNGGSKNDAADCCPGSHDFQFPSGLEVESGLICAQRMMQPLRPKTPYIVFCGI